MIMNIFLIVFFFNYCSFLRHIFNNISHKEEKKISGSELFYVMVISSLYVFVGFPVLLLLDIIVRYM